ncbi:DeoR/GlpR family DNA-binding transcription regulator [Cohnella candidum]|uniref:DeoR/GlpR transcriptional regulator n=1 Tax=Cohnella candidum TaxID=2674991 RepID=A0A3G3K496_9BACL|nr:DeoR/GlpR family DNA-binding transcription regulator [Cohnella candidum]AYQ75220.1 DeoR/GlpR transcriptional regulator [Cohnella candidum]
MYEAERKRKIMEILNETLRVDVQSLNQWLGVSESTIRRDLKELEEANLLKRTHGGAILPQNVNFEPTFLEKEISRGEAKKAIAAKAAELVREGDVILLDSGTTMLYLAKELKRFRKLTVVTNAIPVAQELHAFDGIELIVIGGSLRKGIWSLVGPFAEQILGMIHVDTAFVGTNAIHPEAGLSTPNVDEASIKRKMIASAKKTVLLADSSKIGEVNLVKYAALSEIDTFVTDDEASEDGLKELAAKGLKIEAVVCRGSN